ncbi:MAG: uroporphyrinogen-III synthase, partial [Aquincola sp.]|nr:uroporphyrinogen-III synthase [Aquincola sp.]
RGDGGRDWLADTLRAHGAQVEFLQAYRRGAPRLSPSEQAQLQAALADPAAHLWLFSSGEAIGHLQTLAPGADWRAALALATHPRIEARARALGVGQVFAARPSFEAVVAAARDIAKTP